MNETEVFTLPDHIPNLSSLKSKPQDRSYGTGKRKRSIARVWISPGHGHIIINGRWTILYGKIINSATNSGNMEIFVLDNDGNKIPVGKEKDLRIIDSESSQKRMFIGVSEIACHDYFSSQSHWVLALSPFECINQVNKFDIYCTLRGGGISGQAGALKHGISRALLEYDSSLRAILKPAGFLTRDARVVEPKKCGRKKARKKKQYSKR